MRRGLLMAVALLSIVTMVSAYATLKIEPATQQINVGTTGTYTIKLNTSDTGSAALQWSTSDDLILARIAGTGSLSRYGTYSFTNTANVEQTFTLEVQPQSGATINQEYEIEVDYKGTSGKVKAIATAGVEPIPELGTVVLTSTGLLGLIGLVMSRRRD